MVLLVYIECICVLYSSYIIVLVVFVCFALGNSRLSFFFLYSPGLWEGLYIALLLFTLLVFTLLYSTLVQFSLS